MTTDGAGTTGYYYTGALTYTGGSVSGLALDYSLSGSTLKGTMTIGSTVYDIATYAATSATAVATPTFSVASGAYSTAQTVSLSCSTSGAAIYYTLDGTTPSAGSTEYTGTAIQVSASKAIRAIGIKSGMPSSVVSIGGYVFPPPSSNADLLSLSASAGSLSPAFSAATTAYTLSVPYAETSVTISGTKADNTATVSAPVTLTGLVVGVEKVATITVTANNGTLKAYTVTVTRSAPSANARLSGIDISSGTIGPTIDDATIEYYAGVPNTVDTITINGIKADSNASVTINPAQPSALSVGPNVITITVTAQDGSTSIAYKVTVYKTGSTPSDYVSANIGTLKGVPSGAYLNNSLITVPAFRMSENEITRPQFLAIMGTDPSETYYSTGTDAPVQNVNWYHAIAFCNKLSINEGLTPVYSVAGVNFSTLTYAQIPTTDNATWNAVTPALSNSGYRLPTDQEWIWAAIGARDGTTWKNKSFSGSTGSNSVDDYVWHSGNCDNKSHPVGLKLPNELGIHDMSGNVHEWVWDYALQSTNYHITRGGSYYDGSGFDQAPAHVSVSMASTCYNTIGIRVIRP
jgi:hypothetical protein